MKSYKKKEKSLYTLLIKNYVIFAAVLLLAVQILGLLEELMDQKIARLPRIDHPVGEQEKLADEDYGSLSMKALLGTEGYFDIYTAAGERLYTDYDAFGSSYTPEEISLIPECNTHVSYETKNYEMEDGSRQILVTESKREEDTGYQENIAYYLFDGELRLLESSVSFPYKQITERELRLFTAATDNGYSTYKYSYRTGNGEDRILLMHVKRMDRQRVKRLMVFKQIFIPVYVLILIGATLFFALWMHRRVREPLFILKNGIQDFADGKRDTVLSYQGPREFEDIFSSFNRMAVQLKESESAKEYLIMEKQRMLADISHDLKTPITVIQGYAKAVADGLTDEEMQKQYLNTIVKKAESLTDMINTFHDYSKLEHPEFCLVRETQDLAEYLREYLAEKYDEIDLGGFNLEVEIPEETVSYSFDRVQMKRVFDNIISNSLRHNPPGTVIYVTLQQSDKAVRIEIGDSGVGIPLELQDTLFDPFIVGDESRNTRQGSGLGLAVAHKIIELHGGALFLEKGEQHGNGISTLFVIRLLK